MILSRGNGNISLLDTGFLLEFNILFMFLDELGTQLYSIVLMPEFLHLFGPLVTLNLLLDGLTCLFVHLNDLGSDYLINLVGRHLID